MERIGIHPDGRLISEEYEADGTKIKIWNLQTGQCDSNFIVRSRLDKIAKTDHKINILPDGRIVFELDSDKLIIYDLLTGTCDNVFTDISGIVGIKGIVNISLLPDGRIITSSGVSTIKIWS